MASNYPGIGDLIEEMEKGGVGVEEAKVEMGQGDAKVVLIMEEEEEESIVPVEVGAGDDLEVIEIEGCAAGGSVEDVVEVIVEAIGEINSPDNFEESLSKINVKHAEGDVPGERAGNNENERDAPEVADMNKEEDADATVMDGSWLEGSINIEGWRGLIKGMHIVNDPKDKEKKLELVSKLEGNRMESADLKRMARREAWKEEQKMEWEKREEFKNKMSSISLEEVMDSKDKLAMSKISLQWREGLKDERTKFLVREVAPLLHKPQEKELENAHVSTNDILSCRLVCKEWKTAIDTCLSDEFTSWKYMNNHRIGKKVFPVDLPWCSPKLEDGGVLERFNFWSEHTYTGTNPFISRKLEIGLGSATVEWDDNLLYWNQMEVLLRRWGKELWQVNIQFDKGVKAEVMYEHLVKYLGLMPNLKYLGMYLHDMDPSEAAINDIAMDILDTLRIEGKDGLEELKNLVTNCQLPELPQLKDIIFDYIPHLSVMRAMLSKYGGGLESVYLKGHWMDPTKFLEGSNLSFPLVKKLTSFCYLVVVENYKSYCYELTFNFPSAEDIWLNYSYLQGPEDLRNLFRNVNRLAPSNSLILIWDTMNVVDGLPDDIFLELPKLKLLFASASGMNLKNIDFLLPCVSLKKFVMTYQKNESWTSWIGMNWFSSVTNRRQEIIQYTGYLNRLYESNIWRLLPELKEISIGTITITKWPWGRSVFGKPEQKTYTREGYQQHLKNPGGAGASDVRNYFVALFVILLFLGFNLY